MSKINTARALLYFYVALFLIFSFLTWACSGWGVQWGQDLAKSVSYVTFISHLALVITMIGAIAAQIVAVKQDEDADVQEAVDAVEHLAEKHTDDE